MTTTVRLRLKGADAKLGKVAAADVATLLAGLQAALARASGHVIGKRLKRTGRWTSVVEGAVRLQLVSITSGSVNATLQFPDLPVDALSLGFDVESLGELALERTLDEIEQPKSRSADVARSLHAWTTDLGIGTRHDAIEIVRAKGRSRRRVLLDRDNTDRLRAAVEASIRNRKGTLAGVLTEADFESNSARLRMGDGAAVSVEFDVSLADSIQEALRQPTSVRGEVHFDPATQAALSVELQQLQTGDQLLLDLLPGEFWRTTTIEQLQAQQGITPVTDLAALRDKGATKKEVDAILAALDA